MSSLRIGVRAAAVWSAFVGEWQQTGRQKATWIAIVVGVGLILAPIFLAERAFGPAGFEASGGGRGVVSFVALGWIALTAAQQALLGGQGFLRWANNTGLLPHIWTTRVDRWIPFVGVALFEVVNTVVMGLLLIGVLVVLTDAGTFRLSPLAAPVVAGSLVAFWGFGIALGGTGIALRQWTLPGLINAAAFTMAGATFPVAMLPWEVRWISLALPHTYIVDAIRHTLLGTPTVVPFEVELAIVFASAVGGVVGGIWLFNRIDRYAVRRGLIGLYT